MRRGRVADWPAPLRAGLGQKAPPPGPPLSSRGFQFPCIHGFPACVIDGWAIPSAGSALVPPDLSIFCAPHGGAWSGIAPKRDPRNGAQLWGWCVERKQETERCPSALALPIEPPSLFSQPRQAPNWMLETTESRSAQGHRPPKELPHRPVQDAGKLSSHFA